MSNVPSEYQPVTLKDEIREERVMCKDEMPEVVGDDWMQVLLQAAQRYSRKRLRKAYADRVRENWHDYDRAVYDYYGYEEEMMNQKDVEEKLQIYQLREICKNELREPICKSSIARREMVAMGEEQERLEEIERSSRKRNLKIYMDRVRENWHDHLVCDYYGYEEERMKQEDDEMKYKEVQGAFKRTKHATDGSYTTNSSTGNQAEEPSQKVAKRKGNKRAPEDDSVEEDVRTKTIHLDRYNETKYMMIDYNILTRDTSSIPKDQLAIHLKVCKMIKRRLGMT